MSTSRPLLSLQDVSLKREEQLVLENVNLDLHSGEFVYLIGEVGSGKSTLLKSIYADVQLSSGEERFLDYNLRKIKKKEIPYLRRHIGIVFQDFRLLQDRSVLANLSFVLRATGMRDKKEIQSRSAEVLQAVSMDHKGYKMPHELSGGEQQRVVIARALLNKPELILADEPTGNLDPKTGEQILSLLTDISKENNTAVIVATHNYNLLKKYPARVLRIEQQSLKEVRII